MKLNFIYFLVLNILISVNVMAEKPYHHLADGTFRNPEGSPERDPNIKWSYKVFNDERKKIKINFPNDFLQHTLLFSRRNFNLYVFLINGKNYRTRIAPELFTKPNSIPGTVINSVDPIFRSKKNSKQQISFAFRNFSKKQFS